jgi:hypothetical protein
MRSPSRRAPQPQPRRRGRERKDNGRDSGSPVHRYSDGRRKMIFALYALAVIATGIVLALRAIWKGSSNRKRWLGAAGWCAAVVLALFVSYDIAYPVFSYHVRLAIEIDDHGSKKTGSTVVEIRQTPYPSFGGLFGGGREISSHGEAIFLDLGEGGNLVALLGLGGFCCGAHDDIFQIVDRTFFVGDNQGTQQNGPLAEVERIVTANLGKVIELPPDRMPTLVRFRDPEDPKTMEEASPVDLEKNYGEGITFLRSTIEITDVPVTEGVIDKRLPWLRAMIGDDPLHHHLPDDDLTVSEVNRPLLFFVGFKRT